MLNTSVKPFLRACSCKITVSLKSQHFALASLCSIRWVEKFKFENLQKSLEEIMPIQLKEKKNKKKKRKRKYFHRQEKKVAFLIFVLILEQQVFILILRLFSVQHNCTENIEIANAYSLTTNPVKGCRASNHLYILCIISTFRSQIQVQSKFDLKCLCCLWCNEVVWDFFCSRINKNI